MLRQAIPVFSATRRAVRALSPIEGKYYDWPVGYHVSLKLQTFWTLEDHTLGQPTFTHFPDGTAAHKKSGCRRMTLVQSVMYRRGITWFQLP